MTKIKDSKLDFLDRRLDMSQGVFDSYTTLERDAIIGIKKGMVIFNSDEEKYQGYNGNNWESFTSSTPGNSTYGKYSAIVDGIKYNNVKEAYDDGHNDIIIEVDCSESSSIVLRSEEYLNVLIKNKKEWSLVGHQIDMNSSSGVTSLSIVGDSHDATIAAVSGFVTNFSTDSELFLDNVDLKVPQSPLNFLGRVFVTNCRFIFPNVSSPLFTLGLGSKIDGLIIEGTGTSGNLLLLEKGTYNNIYIEGNYAINAGVINSNSEICISNIYVQVSNVIQIAIGGVINNVIDTSNNLELTLNSSYSYLSNSSASKIIVSGFVSYCGICNCFAETSLDILSGAQDTMIANVRAVAYNNSGTGTVTTNLK